MSNLKCGILWFVLSLVVSVFNDAVIKYLSVGMSSYQILQYRFLFATLTMLPLVFIKIQHFKTSRMWLHALRGGILFIAMLLWCQALAVVQITAATIISFTIPIFVLIMAPIFLKERVPVHLWFATIVCFCGILIIIGMGSTNYNMSMLKMLVSAALFASLDIVNKRFVTREPLLVMLFYSNVFTLILSFLIFGVPKLGELSITQYALLTLLGVGANSILYCVLKAFSYINASLLAPYRYLELVISFAAGYVIFNESVTKQFILGAAIIMLSTFYVSIRQRKKL